MGPSLRRPWAATSASKSWSADPPEGEVVLELTAARLEHAMAGLLGQLTAGRQEA